jgi:pyruvate formate lyase activating enzyme
MDTTGAHRSGPGSNPAVEETTPVQAFQKQPSMIDFAGHLAAVFFCGGCNFRCRYCHNAELIETRAPGLSWRRLTEVGNDFTRNWVDAAVITGGEPTLHADLPRCIARLRAFGWRIKLDTNGSRPDMLERCLPHVDYVAMDVKAGPAGYEELTGYGQTAAIGRSIALVREQARDYCFRTTVVESIHTDEQMHEIGKWIRGARRYILQPFVPRESVLDAAWRRLPRTAPQRLAEIARIMEPYVQTVEIPGEGT